MSLDSFSKNKDLQIKKNMEDTINPNRNNAKKTKSNLNFDQLKKVIPEKEEKKRSVTFSITESQLSKMEKEAIQRGFKNKSEFLASFIDAL